MKLQHNSLRSCFWLMYWWFWGFHYSIGIGSWLSTDRDLQYEVHCVALDSLFVSLFSTYFSYIFLCTLLICISSRLSVFIFFLVFSVPLSLPSSQFLYTSSVVAGEHPGGACHVLKSKTNSSIYVTWLFMNQIKIWFLFGIWNFIFRLMMTVFTLCCD